MKYKSWVQLSTKPEELQGVEVSSSHLSLVCLCWIRQYARFDVGKSRPLPGRNGGIWGCLSEFEFPCIILRNYQYIQKGRERYLRTSSRWTWGNEQEAEKVPGFGNRKVLAIDGFKPCNSPGNAGMHNHH